MLSDQGRTDEVESFLTKREATAEVRSIEMDYEHNPRFYYHLGDPCWYVIKREVKLDERDHHSWACANYPNGW